MSLSLTGLTGEGHQPLDPYVLVATMFVEIHVTTVPPKARLVGNGTITKSVWGLGEFGFGWFPDDPDGADPAKLSDSWFIHKIVQNVRVLQMQGGYVYFGSFWWRLNAGTTINADILW